MSFASIPIAIFNVSKEVYFKCQQVKRFREDCTKLSGFVKRAEDFLLEVMNEADTDGPGWQAAFTALHESFVEVSEIMSDCARFGMIRSLINADDMTHRFHSCTQRLQLALQMIPIQKQQATDAKLASMHDLQADLRQAQFTAAREAELQSARLKRLMDQSRVDSSKTHDMLEAIMGMLQVQQDSSSGMTPEERAALEEEMDDLKEELQQARRLKKTVEEQYINQIMQALEAADNAAAAAAAAAQDAGSGSSIEPLLKRTATPPKNLTCPISCQLFRDPVILIASGQTYERVHIEEWLGRGNMKDPLTGEVISTTQLCPNMLTKSNAQEWLMQHPEYKEPEVPEHLRARELDLLQEPVNRSGSSSKPAGKAAAAAAAGSPGGRASADKGSSSKVASSCRPAGAAGQEGVPDEVTVAKEAYRRAVAAAAAGTAATTAVYRVEQRGVGSSSKCYQDQQAVADQLEEDEQAAAAAGRGASFKDRGRQLPRTFARTESDELEMEMLAAAAAADRGPRSGKSSSKQQQQQQLPRTFASASSHFAGLSLEGEEEEEEQQGGARQGRRAAVAFHSEGHAHRRAAAAANEPSTSYDGYHSSGSSGSPGRGARDQLQAVQGTPPRHAGSSSVRRSSVPAGSGGSGTEGGGVTLQDFRETFRDMRNSRQKLTMKYGRASSSREFEGAPAGSRGSPPDQARRSGISGDGSGSRRPPAQQQVPEDEELWQEQEQQHQRGGGGSSKSRMGATARHLSMMSDRAEAGGAVRASSSPGPSRVQSERLAPRPYPSSNNSSSNARGTKDETASVYSDSSSTRSKGSSRSAGSKGLLKGLKYMFQFDEHKC